MVAKTIQTMHVMTNSQEVPSEVHCEILSTIRSSFDVIPVAPTEVKRGESIPITNNSKPLLASMWLNMLKASQSRSKKVTILHMIEMMGASEWYENELAEAERDPPRTKRGAPRKRLATIVLDEYLKEPQDSTSIKNPEELTSRTVTHLGTLFDQDIWSYVKSSKREIDKVVTLFQANPQKWNYSLSSTNRKFQACALSMDKEGELCNYSPQNKVNPNKTIDRILRLESQLIT
ncbi:hypothetical protein BKA64DRAFT_758493 [Cadophora sp. MPI-SDFR-AT-0126]|nr:hypothetical protein BKA64DRAFT_758493 [Leotiomycetes sp. MPI-SDFR-AT-0126]